MVFKDRILTILGFLSDFGLAFVGFGLLCRTLDYIVSFKDIEVNKKLTVNVVRTFGLSMDRILKKCYWTVGNSGRLLDLLLTELINQLLNQK